MLCDISDIGVFFHVTTAGFPVSFSVCNRMTKGCSPDTGVRK